jgi:dUTP pyrophosphatase
MDLPNHHVTVPITLLPHGAALLLPHYATTGSAGMDIMAAIAAPRILKPLERALIPAGFALALPEGYEAQIRPRSGLALKHGITCLNSPGTIDADYRGEVAALLINLGDTDFVIEPAMRIAQMVIAPVSQVAWQQVNSLPSTVRGEGGFGSTGVTSPQRNSA